jgi:sigma-B regulation protein RsbU (phosphoserine phosphatase)
MMRSSDSTLPANPDLAPEQLIGDTMSNLSPSAIPAEFTWQQRLDHVVETMRELSKQTDPQTMVKQYAQRVRKIMPSDSFVAISRRNLEAPQYRITRSTLWEKTNRAVNPWENGDQLPVFGRGLFGELIYSERPALIENLSVESDDPAAEYCDGSCSLLAIPLFDQGISLNMIILLSRRADAFDRERIPEHVWMSNLFGRATHNLVLSGEVQKAYDNLDREMQVVADIQRSLLPAELPAIPTLEMAAYYQTSRRAGGDYYDFFPLPGALGEPAGSPRGRWGILMADVSGHGTPAAVLMAVCHSIAHTHHGPPASPSDMLSFLNRHLAARYTLNNGSFVTAFYGIYDPASRKLMYASAGHCPPRRMRARDRQIESLDGVRNLPLGIEPGERYEDVFVSLEPGDAVLFYTDGITEGRVNRSADLFGIDRVDEVLRHCDTRPDEMVRRTLESLNRFTAGSPPTDDRTLLAVRVTK